MKSEEECVKRGIMFSGFGVLKQPFLKELNYRKKS